ncbi:MAG: aldo/keto reductase [Thermoproteota archaeon]|nr:aldo/keto reductase [Candidatus Brockarchaeota archaeon]
MEYVKLGKSDLKVSIIGLGAWQASGKAWGADVEDDQIVKAIVRAHELGVNLIDTAEAYGNGHSEEVVARAIREVGRDNLIIATKVHGGHLRYDDVLKAAENSLRRLGIKEIDLYQVHWPDPWEQVPLKHTMRAMEKLYKEGKIRAIGVSNFAVRDLEEARRHLSDAPIVSNQVRYNMLQRDIEEEVIPYCKRENITIIAYSPLAQGALTGKYSPNNKPSDDVRRYNKLFSDGNLVEIGRLLPVLEKIAKTRNKTIAQVAINWLLREGGIVPIPGAKNPEQAEENAGAAGWRLSQQELAEIDNVLKTIKLDFF